MPQGDLSDNTAETTIAALTDSLRTTQGKLVDRQTVMKRRLRHAYMTGTSSPLMILFTAATPADLLLRARYVEEAHRYDRDLVTHFLPCAHSI